MKKLIFFTVLSLISEILFAQSFSGGTGTENDPFIIANSQDLIKLSDTTAKKKCMSSHFKLANDIYIFHSRLLRYVIMVHINLVEHLTAMGKQFMI